MGRKKNVVRYNKPISFRPNHKVSMYLQYCKYIDRYGKPIPSRDVTRLINEALVHYFETNKAASKPECTPIEVKQAWLLSKIRENKRLQKELAAEIMVIGRQITAIGEGARQMPTEAQLQREARKLLEGIAQNVSSHE